MAASNTPSGTTAPSPVELAERLRPALTLSIPNFGTYLPGIDLARLVDVAVMAERAGVDRVMVADHVVMGPNVDTYPWGDHKLNPNVPFNEPLIFLAAVAARTSRIRLGTGVLVAPLRNPVVLAKTAATLDQLSGGRLDLGVGVGWQREEYEACGVDFEARWRLMTDLLDCCTHLWGAQPVSFSGRTHDLKDIYCVPRPAQAGGVPFWLGGGTSAPNLRRLASWCRGWLPIPVVGATADDLAATLSEGVPVVRAAFADSGRDPDELRVSVTVPLFKSAGSRGNDLAASLATVERLREAGATDFAFPIHAFCRDLEEMPSLLATLVSGFDAATSRGVVAP